MYLPQFHTFPENDEWWGKGFTEWTNVGKAKSYFKGHDQPRVPTELGYYNLKDASVREEQAKLAREAGIEGFMYWHYWFGNGKTLMGDIFKEVLSSGKPDFPFCLGWANHSWYSKNWNSDGTSTNKLLIEQTYPGDDDIKQHYKFLSTAFKDKRYIKVEGKPLFVIYDPNKFPEHYLKKFQELAIEDGFPGIFFICYLGRPEYDKDKYISMGYDMVMYQRLDKELSETLKKMGFIGKVVKHLKSRINGILHKMPPYAKDYSKIYHQFITPKERDNDVVPIIIPQWDHSPRSGRNGIIFYNSTPNDFYNHACEAIESLKYKTEERQIIILKSWNEWGEGNYMEPDITNGKGYIKALHKAIEDTCK